jgi:hypothetical protein
MMRRISRATMVAGPIAAVMAIVVCFVPTLPAFAATAPVTAAPTPGVGACTPVDPTYVTRPDLRPAGACTNFNTSQAAPGYLFSAPNEFSRGGPAIYASDGSVVWTKPRSFGDEQTFKVITVGGRRLLAYWHGAWPVHNIESRGEFVLLDEHYHEVGRIQSIAGQPSIHELQITPAGTALIGAYTQVLKVVSGRPVWVFDYVVSEVDFQHGNKVLFEWRALDHVPLSESWQTVPPTLGSFDYFHGDGIDLLPGGDLLISGRFTYSVYRVSRADGHIVWTLGNPHDGSGTFGPELLGSDDGWFCSQHEARRAGDDDTITVMDDAGTGLSCSHAGREVTIRLDQAAKTATAISIVRHVPDLYTQQTHSAPLPNGNTMVSWGDSGEVTEYDASGQPVMDMTIGVYSYRVWKSEWQGFPDEPPVAVLDGSNLVVSWNGATEVARWQLLGGSDRDSLGKIGDPVPRQGFETSIPVPPGIAVVGVQALDANGAVLAHGEAVAGSPASALPFFRPLRGALWFFLNYGGFGLLVGWSVELGLLLGALLATVRLVRGQGGRRAARGFAGMTLLIILANLTGCLAQSFYPPVLYLNLAYPALFLITNLIGWPLIGVLTGLIDGGGARWRRDPASMRAFRLAGWLWVAFFALKFAVQLPLYLAADWMGLWTAKVLLGWPLWIVAVVATVVVVRRARRTKEPEAPAVGTSATEETTEEAAEAAVPRPAMA